tara:strand:+ start:141 stop:821 length:681 start_codon:yes stop_codon:yes gene_type:complete
MSEGSPWSRLGKIPAIESKEEEVPSKDILIIKDQIAEMSKLIMNLVTRVEELEIGSNEPIDNLLEIATPEELGIVTLDSAEPLEPDADVVVVKSGFTAPPPDEMEEIRESQKSHEEPIGTEPDETSEEVVEQKEFGEEYEMALIMADLLTEYIQENGAVLNNQAKKRVFTPAEINPSASDKRRLKELIADGHTKFRGHKMDNFRTLYYIGDDYAEEYEKSYGSKSD